MTDVPVTLIQAPVPVSNATPRPVDPLFVAWGLYVASIWTVPPTMEEAA